ncbi:hypothetical protein DL93DRAFT_2088583 [Clavulina sp. PMI_390]|nr:hypothetical protein DL93DRAFT_2088583 [Clavulina sp. PMI_390]
MARIFNVVRASIFIAAFIFALVVLSLAAYLDSILVASSLTTFVDVALIVSLITILCTAAILFFGSREREWRITQTRWEVILTGMMGVLWLILALYLSLLPLPEVECSGDSSYTTDDFHAQYHVIQALAVLELILLCGWAIFLFTLAMRHHLAGRKQVWNARVNEAVWFQPRKSAKDSSQERFTRLPPPISARPKHRRGFSSPVSYFTRKNPDEGAGASRPGLQRNESGSSRSVTTEESHVGVLPSASMRERPRLGVVTGAAGTHGRSRSEPAVMANVPPPPPRKTSGAGAADAGAGLTRSRSATTKPPTVPPKQAGASTTRRPSAGTSAAAMAAASATAAAAAVSRSKATPTRSASQSQFKAAPSGRPPVGGRSATAGAIPTSQKAKPTPERRPTTTRTPKVYVPTPPRSPIDPPAVTMPPIAAMMMQEKRNALDRDRDRGRPPVSGSGGAAPRRKGSLDAR